MLSARFRARLRDDEGSLLIAVLMIIIVTGLVLAVTATVISGVAKTRSEHAYAVTGEAADAGIADALYSLNSQKNIEVYTAATPKVQRFGASEVTWYAVRTPGAQVGTSYNIHATAKLGRRTRTFVATISGITTTGCPPTGPSCGGSNNGGTISYLPTPGFGFTQAAFGDKEIAFAGAVTVDSYDSAASGPGVGAGGGSGVNAGTGNGTVASNGKISLAGTAARPADKVILWDYQAKPFADRCIGPPCSQDNVTQQPARIDIATQQGAKFIDDAFGACLANGRIPEPWIASQSTTRFGSTARLQPTAGRACYASLDFDQNTDIVGTLNSPTTVYVSGPIIVRPGVRVNIPNGTPNKPTPAGLVIYNKGSVVTIGHNSNVAWALWSPFADCNPGGNDASRADIYGSTICSTITSGTGWRFHYDDQLVNIASPVSGVVRAWSITSTKRQ